MESSTTTTLTPINQVPERKVLLQTECSSLWIVPNFTQQVCPDNPITYDQVKEIYTEHEPEIVIYGKVCHQRRDVGFYSDTSAGYRYSGAVKLAAPLSEHPVLVRAMNMVNKYLGTVLFGAEAKKELSFNGILVNRYRNGEKYLSAHSDDERGLSHGLVAGLAYGPGLRKFRIRNKKTKVRVFPPGFGQEERLGASTNSIVLDITHEQDMLIVMDGDFQKEFTHEIPPEKRVSGERISLTFREHRE